MCGTVFGCRGMDVSGVSGTLFWQRCLPRSPYLIFIVANCILLSVAARLGDLVLIWFRAFSWAVFYGAPYIVQYWPSVDQFIRLFWV